MKTYPSDDGAAAFVSLEPGEDLLDGLNGAVAELGYQAATVQLIGALREGHVGYLDQEAQEYRSIRTGAVEITAGLGNVSIRDGSSFIHLHLTLARADGSCIGGHAMDGCVAFVAEGYFRALAGSPPVREERPGIGLKVWPGS